MGAETLGLSERPGSCSWEVSLAVEFEFCATVWWAQPLG